MKIKAASINENRFQRIINVLLLNASFIDNIGLMHGKMGIAIFFFHLSRETQNQVYENYAGELIDEIYEEITVDTPLDFENGLAGIGWGIEYLVQNGFLEADTDEVLEDFDNRLQPSQYQFQGIGLLKGLIGVGAYYLKRIQKSASADEEVSTLMNKQMIVLLIDELELRIENEGIMTLVKESNTFNLTWDYPVLIVFLTEVHQLNIFNSKVDRMLQKVINPLIQQNSLPKLQSKRLLLALAIERIKNCKIKQFQNGSIDELIQKLLSGLERETIIKELTPNSAFLQKGTSGIAWIYKQIFVLTGNSLYQHEEEQWISQSFKAEELENGYAGFFILKEQEYTALGLLEGLTGIALLSVGIKISNFLLN